MLLGRDALRIHKVRRQINGLHNAPFAIKTGFGWLIVGDKCLGKPTVLSYKTHVLDNNRTTYYSPCLSHIKHTRDDNKPTLSVEDRLFMEIIDNKFFRYSDSFSFRYPRPPLPSNREQAVTRLYSLCRTLLKKPEMKQQFTDFMQRLFENDHAEYAPLLSDDQECWYLPFFGVYHPKNPTKLKWCLTPVHNITVSHCIQQCPFDRTRFKQHLVRCPDLIRKKPVAVTVDIQQMSHCFTVKEDHRDYLRFDRHLYIPLTR
ncbi:Protein TIC236 [Labeo rohita]|uniref:Protein TIC236 n=1 Tax=Labeo rohita TaxID=84645 RepID=A0ABQ8LP67_LABRO|nr:Protein TIC236 [Labeo rohita]